MDGDRTQFGSVLVTVGVTRSGPYASPEFSWCGALAGGATCTMGFFVRLLNTSIYSATPPSRSRAPEKYNGLPTIVGYEAPIQYPATSKANDFSRVAPKLIVINLATGILMMPAAKRTGAPMACVSFPTISIRSASLRI